MRKTKFSGLIPFCLAIFMLSPASGHLDIQDLDQAVAQGEKLKVELNYSIDRKSEIKIDAGKLGKSFAVVEGEGLKKFEIDTSGRSIGDYKVKASLANYSDSETVTVTPDIKENMTEFEGGWKTVFGESFELIQVLFMDMIGSEADYDEYFTEEAVFFPKFFQFLACKAEPFIEEEFNYCHVFSHVDLQNFPESLLKIDKSEIKEARKN